MSNDTTLKSEALPDSSELTHADGVKQPSHETDEPKAPAQKEESPVPAGYEDYYAEASLTKKLTVFALASVVVLIALGMIYALWPLGTPR